MVFTLRLFLFGKNEYEVQVPLYEDLKILWKVKIQVEQIRQAQQPHKQHQQEIK